MAEEYTRYPSQKKLTGEVTIRVTVGKRWGSCPSFCRQTWGKASIEELEDAVERGLDRRKGTTLNPNGPIGPIKRRQE